ncbi:unnamed protein product, partial [Prorocentrum cordatum]
MAGNGGKWCACRGKLASPAWPWVIRRQHAANSAILFSQFCQPATVSRRRAPAAVQQECPTEWLDRARPSVCERQPTKTRCAAGKPRRQRAANRAVLFLPAGDGFETTSARPSGSTEHAPPCANGSQRKHTVRCRRASGVR